MSDKPYITKMTVHLSQEGNTLGSTEEFEEMQIDFDYQLPPEGPFIVIRTEGWSCDDMESFSNLINKLVISEEELRKSLE